MTTDLTDDFELGEDEFDWDVFVPDPDEAELAAQAAALDDEAELSLDDSEFDWEALREDSELDGGHAGSEDDARAGAAFDRIVDTVRRTYEEPESDIEADQELDSESGLEREVDLELASETDQELDSESGLGREVDLELASETDQELDSESDPEREVEPEFESELEQDGERDPEPETTLALEAGFAAATEAELEPRTPLSDTEPVSEAQMPQAERVPQTIGTVTADLDSSLAAVPEEPWGHETQPASAGGPVHARKRRSAEGQPRSRVFTTTLVLASLLVVFLAGVAAARALHHPTTAAGPPARSSSGVSSSAGVSRLQTATDAADSATTAARVGLTSLSSFPTPTNVATVMNLYISSLQLYETILSETDAPAAARSAAASAESQVRQDLKSLVSIDGLPPVQLGSYLEQFDTDATQLQTTLSALEQDLRPSGS